MSSGHRKAINWAAVGIGLTLFITLVSWATRSLGAAYTVGGATTRRDARVEQLEKDVVQLKATDERILKEVRDYIHESNNKLDQILEKTSKVQGAFEQHTYQDHRDPLVR
jgi:hypothetical protein